MISTLIREESLEEIDLGRGGDTYKRDWLAQSRMRSGVIAGNWKTLAGLRTIAREVLPTRLSAVVRGGVWSLNR
jgi:CelD/BcsL family acetyltransferase involved in cellulose biosynthesis